MGGAGHRVCRSHRPPQASPGLTDSKLISPKRRAELAPLLERWVTAYALGDATPQEIDELGMTAALRLAAVRALEALPVRPDAVILDGKHDYLGLPWQVRTVIKGDQSCVAVAAASVIAKVRRDAVMAELGAESGEYTDFAFDANAGLPVPCAQGRVGGAGPHGPSPPLVVLPRRAAQVAAPQEGPLLRRGGRTGKRGPARLRLLIAHMCPPADASCVGV